MVTKINETAADGRRRQKTNKDEPGIRNPHVTDPDQPILKYLLSRRAFVYQFLGGWIIGSMDAQSSISRRRPVGKAEWHICVFASVTVSAFCVWAFIDASSERPPEHFGSPLCIWPFATLTFSQFYESPALVISPFPCSRPD